MFLFISEKMCALFISDIIIVCLTEAKAAATAGMQAVLVSRPGNAPLTVEEKKEFLVIHSFNELNIL